MNCCCLEATGKFFDKHARRSEKYFRKKGLRKEQRYLVEGIRQHFGEAGTILEIGCGVGALHLSLLQAGATHATGYDVSEEMIVTAQRLAAERQLADRARYVHGDFVEVHAGVVPADITILDKVICCYENVHQLLMTSLAKTKRFYAVSYPRQSAWVRMMIKLYAAISRLMHAPFYPFYHDPRRVQAWIIESGFSKVYEQHTWWWVVQVFGRTSAEAARPPLP